jgi:hypothetical protein
MSTRLEQLQAAAKAKTAAGQPIFTSTVNAPQVATPAVQTAAVPAPTQNKLTPAPQPIGTMKASSTPAISPQIQTEIQRKAAAGIPLTNTSNAANNAAYAAAVPKAAVTPVATPKAAVSPTVSPTAQATPTTNYVAQGGKTLNDILYLKDNYNASNKNYIASQANPLYAQLDPNTAAMVKGMSADQLRSYINGMGAKSPTTTSETSIEEVVPKDYRSLATAAYERELAAMMAGAQAQETELNRRNEYADFNTGERRVLQDSSIARNEAPVAWDGSGGYRGAQRDRSRDIEDHYTDEALKDNVAAAYAQTNAFRDQSGNYIETKASELESAEKQYNLQLAGLTGEINGQQTIQGAASAASTAGQLLSNQSQAISNQIAQIDLANYPETSQLQIKQLQQQVQSGKISNDTAAYQLTQLTDPNSATNQAAALDLAMKSIDASNYSEAAKLQLEQLRKTVAEIGKTPYQSDADARLDQLKVLTAEAELQKLQEIEAKAAGKTYEDYQSNIEKLAVRDNKTGALKNPDVVEEYIVNSDLSEYEMYRAYRANGLTWGGAVPSKGE